MDAGIATVLATVWDGARAADLEDVTLDFKTVCRSIGDALKDLAEAAMCFANAQGGTIVVGIQDGVGGPKAFVGSPLDPTRTVSRVYELTEPGLIVIVDAVSYQGVQLSVITVQTSWPSVAPEVSNRRRRCRVKKLPCSPRSATPCRFTAGLSSWQLTQRVR